MSKKKAHIILILADIFALLVFWWGYHKISQVFVSVANSADAVSFINRAGIPFVCIAMPMIHLLGIYDYFWPNFLAKRTALVNRSVIILGIVLFAIAFFISSYMKTYVEQAGYQYCRGASGVSALFRTLVYTKDPDVCSRLTNEKRKRLHLPSK